MKTVSMIVKIVIALAAVAAAVYVVATYGEKIVAWARNLMGACKRFHPCDCTCGEDDCCCGETCCCEEELCEADAAEEADFEA